MSTKLQSTEDNGDLQKEEEEENEDQIMAGYLLIL
jgi:hypothetical protein